MSAEVELAFPESGDLSESDRERVDDLVVRLAATVGVEPSELPSLSVERTDTSILVRPDVPVYSLKEGTRYEVRAVSHSDTGVNSTGLKTRSREPGVGTTSFPGGDNPSAVTVAVGPAARTRTK
jgi:hypothetical protein